MGEVALALFVFTLFWWAPAVWVFFDAWERGHSAYLWGALSLLFSLLAIVVYFFVRSRPRDSPPGSYSRARIYLHVAIVTFWGLVAIGVIAVLWGIFRSAGAETTPASDPDEDLRNALALGIPLLLLMGPALVAHVLLTRRSVARAEAEERRSLARLQFGLFSLLLVITSLLAAFVVILLVFAVIGQLLDVGDDLDRSDWAALWAAAPVSLISLALTVALFWADAEFQRGRALLREAAVIAVARPTPEQAPPPRSAARFCTQCGQQLPAAARFCPACGTAATNA